MNMIELFDKAKLQYGEEIKIVKYDETWPGIKHLLWIQTPDGNTKAIIGDKDE